VIAPYAINAQSVVDCVLVLLVAVLLFVLSRNEKISKKEGVLFVLLYVAYSVYVFVR